MEEMQLLDAVERYLADEMPAEEKAYFEQLRKSNPEVDQLVVEHSMFLQQMGRFSDWKQYKSTLNEVHTQLIEEGSLKDKAPKATVAQLIVIAGYTLALTFALPALWLDPLGPLRFCLR